MEIEEENKFDFYVGKGIESLRNIEDWSDGKIASHLRRVAQELSPRKGKPKKIIIPKEVVEEFIKKNQKQEDGNSSQP